MESIYFFCFLLFLVVFPNKSLSTNSDLISKTCDRSTYKEFCKSFLKDHGGSKARTLQELVVLPLKFANSQVVKIQNKIRVLIKTAPSDPEILNGLLSCADTFKQAFYSTKESTKELSDNRYDDVLSSMTRAMTFANDCELVYREFHLVSPVHDMTDVFFQTCEIESTIMVLLEEEKKL
ncbi:hypothetical protein ACFE04_008389 [Oxalis oulophora]